MKKNLTCIFIHLLTALLICGYEAEAQYFMQRLDAIPGYSGNRQLRFPWAGGLNNPQLSAADLNNDGIEDLVVFDRSGFKILTFLNNGTPGVSDYSFAPGYTANFPCAEHWMLLGDFNCDNVADIYTSTPGRVDYYQGYFDQHGKLHFRYIDFFKYKSFSGIINIFVSSVDIPAIEDINNDGDKDILTFNFGTSTVIEYYENLSRELTGNCGDTLLFRLKDRKWAGIVEDGFTREVTIDSCNGFSPLAPQPGEYNRQRHAGSTLLAFDEDGDGDKELLLGNVLFETLNRIKNGGTPDSACSLDQDPTFPSYSQPVNMPWFAAPFYLDADNDGVKDLLVAPNATSISRNYRCIQFYKNTGSDTAVFFELVTDTFLVKDMFDFGEGSNPAFTDFNQDGLIDIIIGNYGFWRSNGNYKSSLIALRNTGTAANPAFELYSLNYANTSSLGIQGLHPAFGDLDGDGDADMIIGDKDGRLHYFQNTAQPGSEAVYTLTAAYFANIDAGQFATPFLTDINGDGLLDIICGNKSGFLEYYENTGTPQSPQFSATPANPDFGHVDVRETGQIIGYSAPCLAPLDSSGQRYLLVGAYSGKLHVYRFIRDSIYQGAFPLITSFYSGIDDGERVVPAVADVDGDGMPELLTGNYRGGLTFYTATDSLILSDGQVKGRQLLTRQVAVYPNPATDKITVAFRGGQNWRGNVSLINATGQLVYTRYADTGKPSLSIDVRQLPSGIYYLHLQSRDGIATRKVIIYNPK